LALAEFAIAVGIELLEQDVDVERFILFVFLGVILAVACQGQAERREQAENPHKLGHRNCSCAAERLQQPPGLPPRPDLAPYYSLTSSRQLVIPCGKKLQSERYSLTLTLASMVSSEW